MPKHERFEELCAAASIGQASGAELSELHVHLAECPDCERAYADFLEIGAARFASDTHPHELSQDETIECIDSVLLRERFLRKAAAEGIVFANGNRARKFAEPVVRGTARPARIPRWSHRLAGSLAASVLIASAALAGYYWGNRRVVAPRPSVIGTVPSSQAATSAPSAKPAERASGLVSNLEARNRSLASEIEALKLRLESTKAELSASQFGNSVSEKERAALLETVKVRESAISELQGRIEQAQSSASSVRSDLERLQASAQGSQSAVAEAQIRIRDLSVQLADKSAALERERELLTAGRDVRELMAARNLHIVDVFDTDPKGKTRPAFGRIFFTEGKSLIFYAYDLNDSHVIKAGYNFQIWGRKEAPTQRARSLGIFYSDDKAQKRWVFQFDDPKVLSEIDSVFVTLEPPNGSPTQPKGEKLMYAYLRGQANHP